jgi:hypothetical protein
MTPSSQYTLRATKPCPSLLYHLSLYDVAAIGLLIVAAMVTTWQAGCVSCLDVSSACTVPRNVTGPAISSTHHAYARERPTDNQIAAPPFVIRRPQTYQATASGQVAFSLTAPPLLISQNGSHRGLDTANGWSSPGYIDGTNCCKVGVWSDVRFLYTVEPLCDFCLTGDPPFDPLCHD